MNVAYLVVIFFWTTVLEIKLFALAEHRQNQYFVDKKEWTPPIHLSLLCSSLSASQTLMQLTTNSFKSWFPVISIKKPQNIKKNLKRKNCKETSLVNYALKNVLECIHFQCGLAANTSSREQFLCWVYWILRKQLAISATPWNQEEIAKKN